MHIKLKIEQHEPQQSFLNVTTNHYFHNSRFWTSCLDHLGFLLPKTFMLFGFQYVNNEVPDESYSKKQVMCTKFDIYVLVQKL